MTDLIERLHVRPITLRAANQYITEHHRHHGPTVGHKFSVAAYKEGVLVGVVIVGRPVARRSDDGFTAEVLRCCTNGTKNACSILYSAAAKAAFGMGYKKIQTFIRKDESGSSLKASGWREYGVSSGKSWSVPSRPRDDKTELIPRVKFVREQKP